MKRITTFFLALTLTFAVYAQRDSLLSYEIAPFAYPFDLEGGTVIGPGADTLRKAILGSQFFLLGEYHGDRGIGLFTSALLPELASNGYSHFGIEVGPAAAKKLETMVHSNELQETFRRFYSDNATLTGESAIPFFEHHSDIAFLQKAKTEGFDIWGLDQEYLGSYLFILDDLWIDAGRPDRLRASYHSARTRMIEYYQRSHSVDASDADKEALEVYNQLMSDHDFQALCNELAQRACNGTQRVKDMFDSFKIYYDWRADLLRNLEGRAGLMKNYFRRMYDSSNQRFPKVFLKMGGIHTSRGFTQNACYELGTTLSELAQLNGHHSVHVSFATRYYFDPEEPDSIGDNLTYRNEWMNAMRPLLLQAKKDKWVLVDLRALRKVWVNERQYVGRALRTVLESHDFIVLMPPYPDPEPHFDVSLIQE